MDPLIAPHLNIKQEPLPEIQLDFNLLTASQHDALAAEAASIDAFIADIQNNHAQAAHTPPSMPSPPAHLLLPTPGHVIIKHELSLKADPGRMVPVWEPDEAAARDEMGPEPPSPPLSSQDAPISWSHLKLEGEDAEEARLAANSEPVNNPLGGRRDVAIGAAPRAPPQAPPACQPAAKEGSKAATTTKQRGGSRRQRSSPAVASGRVAKQPMRKRQPAAAKRPRAPAEAPAAAPARARPVAKKQPAPELAAAAAAPPAVGGVKKRASGKRRPGERRASRAKTGQPSGRRPGGMHVPEPLLFLYHMNLLGPGGKGRLATEYDTRTDSLAVKVQSFLRTVVQPRLIDLSLIEQTGAAKTREPALGLMKERLMKEGITDWAAFERIYLAPAQRG